MFLTPGTPDVCVVSGHRAAVIWKNAGSASACRHRDTLTHRHAGCRCRAMAQRDVPTAWMRLAEVAEGMTYVNGPPESV